MPRNPTLRETLKIIIGEAIVLVLMFLIFFLFDHFDRTVVYGGLLGAFGNILYFFLLCVGLNGIIARADNEKMRLMLNISYLVRLLLLAVVLAVGLKMDCFNNIAVIIPVLMTRPIIYISEIFGKGIKNNHDNV